MKDFISGLAVIFGTAAVVALSIVGLEKIMPPREQRQSPTELNFRAACKAATGNAVWNGRHWECLK